MEQRGARLKRICREVVSWRPPHDGYLPDKANQGQLIFNKRRKYDSCAMMQLLRACVAQEQEWLSVADRVNMSVSELRLVQRGRASLVKQDPGRRLPAIKEEAGEVIDLT